MHISQQSRARLLPASEGPMQGTIDGKQVCVKDGVEYRFDGQFHGDQPVAYVVAVFDARNRTVGQIEGSVASFLGEDRRNVRAAIEALVRQALKSGKFSRTP
jgi:hypothetical protein